MTAEEFEGIRSKGEIEYQRIKQIPFSSMHSTFWDYEFDLILLIELYSRNKSLPDRLVDKIRETQQEIYD